MKNSIKRGELLTKMIILAANKHLGQVDRGGNPYILHCLAVMHYLETIDEELLCIGVGHDLIEDTDVSYDDLHRLGFTERIIAGISDMTKIPGETDDEYLTGIRANHDAICVKLADLQHNSDTRRLARITKKDMIRLEKYNKMYLILKELV